MRNQRFRRQGLLGLSLSVTLGVAMGGCGGASDSGTAVLVPEPNSLSTKAPAAGTAAPAASTAATATSPEATPAASPVKAEGWGTLKGHGALRGRSPRREGAR